jgi:hypothetical protein
MIKILCDFIDQLDLALDQLALRESNYDRFAMMLIDNVVELVLHRNAMDMSFEYRFGTDDPESMQRAKVVTDALGPRFDNKVKLARMTNLLTRDTAETVLRLHAFRNTAYHRGYRHETILHSLSLQYFKIACDLLTAYNSPYWSFDKSEQLPIRAIKYVGSLDSIFREDKAFEKAWKRLKDVAKSMGDTLATDLYNDMQKSISAADNAIAFLHEHESGSSRDSIVRDTQLWLLAISDAGHQFAQKHGYTSDKSRDIFNWLRAHYPLQISSDPIPGWHARAQDVQIEKDAFAALKKYASWVDQTEVLRNQLDESVLTLEQHLQNELDHLRGK